jgi:hypothetical protein
MTGNVVSRRIGDDRYGIYTPSRLVMQWVSRGFCEKRASRSLALRAARRYEVPFDQSYYAVGAGTSYRLLPTAYWFHIKPVVTLREVDF